MRVRESRRSTAAIDAAEESPPTFQAHNCTQV